MYLGRGYFLVFSYFDVSLLQNKLGEQSIKLIVLDQALLVQAHHLVHEGQLLLQQEVLTKVPSVLGSLLALAPYLLFEP